MAFGRSTPEMVGEGGSGETGWIGEVGAESRRGSGPSGCAGLSTGLVVLDCVRGDLGGRGGNRGGRTVRSGVGWMSGSVVYGRWVIRFKNTTASKTASLGNGVNLASLRGARGRLAPSRAKGALRGGGSRDAELGHGAERTCRGRRRSRGAEAASSGSV